MQQRPQNYYRPQSTTYVTQEPVQVIYQTEKPTITQYQTKAPTVISIIETAKPTVRTTTTTTTTTKSPPISFIQKDDSQEICGVTGRISTSLIYNGKESEKGKWPWIAALLESKNGVVRFFCGGK